ncbi:MAG: LysR family transcriptional regulator [Gammaproteobacteria bacterium]|jgi:DNA-binding transcriptional LysR family regulator
MSKIDWEDLKFFKALADTGSLRAAGSRLAVHPSTVARHVEQFERRLGAHLFNRHPTGLRLTEAGRELLESAERIEGEIQDVERRLAGRDESLSGVITVTLPDVVASGFLMRDLSRFNERYPGVRVDVIPSYETLDIPRREADVAIRVTAHPPEQLVGRRLARSASAPYASHEYIAGQGEVDLARCDWIAFDDVLDISPWVGGVESSPVRPRMRLRSILLLLEAARAGMGVVVLPCSLGDREPGLERLAAPWQNPDHEIWILTHPDLRSSARVRAFMEHVTDAFRRHRPLLEGKPLTEAA